MIKEKKKMIIIISLIVLVALVIGLILVLANKNDNKEIIDNSDNEKENTLVDENEKIESNVKIIDLNSKTRPYAIMINCHNEALPHAGLQDAYLVYELMVEYGVTRLMALFKDADITKVGSIRSSRNQYLAYVFENDAIYVHAGGSPESLERIKNENIDDVDVDGQYGVRDKTLKRAWEHTLFTNSKLLSKGLSDKKLRSTTNVKSVLKYSEEELDLSKYKTQSAKKVSIKYSNYRTSSYEYDKDNKTYLRFMSGKKQVDLVTGNQYKVKNVLVYGVKYTQYTDHRNPNYQRPNNIGKGEGYYITDGLALPITWEKKDEKSQTIYKIKETGEDLMVNDGNTYIQIYPTNGGKLTIE